MASTDDMYGNDAITEPRRVPGDRIADLTDGRDHLADARVPTERLEHGRADHLSAADVRVEHRDEPEIIERLREPDNRARLQLATALIAGATLVLVLIGLLVSLTQGPDEPVLVDGVPCLVQDGEDGQAVLYCQR